MGVLERGFSVVTTTSTNHFLLDRFRTKLKVVEDEARRAKNVTTMRSFQDSGKSKKTVSSMVTKKGDAPPGGPLDELDSPGAKSKKGKKKGAHSESNDQGIDAWITVFDRLLLAPLIY